MMRYDLKRAMSTHASIESIARYIYIDDVYDRWQPCTGKMHLLRYKEVIWGLGSIANRFLVKFWVKNAFYLAKIGCLEAE